MSLSSIVSKSLVLLTLTVVFSSCAPKKLNQESGVYVENLLQSGQTVGMASLRNDSSPDGNLPVAAISDSDVLNGNFKMVSTARWTDFIKETCDASASNVEVWINDIGDVYLYWDKTAYCGYAPGYQGQEPSAGCPSRGATIVNEKTGHLNLYKVTCNYLAY